MRAHLHDASTQTVKWRLGKAFSRLKAEVAQM